MRSAGFWVSVAALTALGYFVFPGHTYLQTDTQIYVPMMERIYNPVLFTEDPMISRPHLALTAYDEIAIGLRNYAGLDFEHGLKLQHFLFRGCAVTGLLLITLRLGLGMPGAFLAVALVILNSGGLGMPITDLDPVARSFAFGLFLLCIGLSVEGYFVAAGIASAVGFLIHPTTMAPFFGAIPFVLMRRAARPILLAPMLVAAMIMALLMHFQTGGTEPIEFFRRLDPFQEDLQRRLMSMNFVSEWDVKLIVDCMLESLAAAAAFWRIRDRLKSPLREWLWALAGVGILSIPFSWIVTDHIHWVMAGPWGPTRALVFVVLPATLLSAACGIFAAQRRAWWEAVLWLGVAVALPVKDLLATWFVNAWLVVLVLMLVGFSIAGIWLADRTRSATLIAAGVLPFVAFGVSGLVPPPNPVDSPELRELAAWAKEHTPETSVFLFADEGAYGGSGPFRARALRSVYVDYEGRALVNYFPRFSTEWAQRWRDVHMGRWLVKPEDFPELAERHIDFVVLKKDHAIAMRPAEFSNSNYVVYRVIPSY